jgi:hypothetical protein
MAIDIAYRYTRGKKKACDVLYNNPFHPIAA